MINFYNFFNAVNFKEIISVTLILFSVIDILGSIPFVIDLKKTHLEFDSFKITIISGMLLFAFLFVGESILTLFGVDVQSFAIAGGLIMFFLGLEMVLNIVIFRHDPQMGTPSPLVPLALPLVSASRAATAAAAAPG